MDIQTARIIAVKCLIRVFFGCKPDWIKYFDRSTGLGSDRVTERIFWTGLGFQKSPISSTLVSKIRLASFMCVKIWTISCSW